MVVHSPSDIKEIEDGTVVSIEADNEGLNTHEGEEEEGDFVQEDVDENSEEEEDNSFDALDKANIFNSNSNNLDEEMETPMPLPLPHVMKSQQYDNESEPLPAPVPEMIQSFVASKLVKPSVKVPKEIVYTAGKKNVVISSGQPEVISSKWGNPERLKYFTAKLNHAYSHQNTELRGPVLASSALLTDKITKLQASEVRNL